jgi:hypothetical protein
VGGALSGSGNVNGGNGGANTGGGGGGCPQYYAPYGDYGVSGSGGSGIVILSYPSTYPDLTSIAVGLTYTKTTSGGNTIYTFTAGTGTVTV